jgi:hypothetical protein
MSAPTTTDVVLRPVRFTADVAAMQRFLELVGLRSRIESVGGGWVDLLGTSGMLALHDAAGSAQRTPPGTTTLSYECADADALATRLTAAVLRAEVVDEAYGRVLLVTGDDSWQVVTDEVQRDLHGYRVHEAGEPICAVSAVVRTGAGGPLRAILHVLGGDVEVRDGDGVPALGPDGGWYVSAPVQVVLTTTEPLERLVTRLEAAGCPAVVGDGVVTVTDPDGQLLEVRRA